jgi:hypothetical protein
MAIPVTNAEGTSRISGQQSPHRKGRLHALGPEPCEFSIQEDTLQNVFLMYQILLNSIYADELNWGKLCTRAGTP